MRALVFAGIVAAACGDNRTIDSSGELAISAIHFGRVVTHGSGTATVANTTSVAVALGAISVTGDGFAVQATTCGAMLDANASCEITVDLAGAHLGAANGTLEVAGVRAALDATFADVVAVSATGGGRITSSPAGIDCGATCSAVFDAPVTLTATPDAGRGFGGWSDPTCGSATTCTITTPRTLSATFAAGVTIAPIHLGTVTVADSGTAVLTNALVTPCPMPAPSRSGTRAAATAR